MAIDHRLSSTRRSPCPPARVVRKPKEDLKIYKSELRSYRFLFLHLRAPAVCAFVFLSCLSFSNLPAIGEQCASEADPFIRAVGIIAHAICTYNPFPLPPLPPYHAVHLHTSVFPVQPFFHPVRVRSKRCCCLGCTSATFNRYQMINETLVENVREKLLCLFVLAYVYTSMIRRVVVRLRNKIESLFNWVRRLWEETIRIFNIVWIWTSGLLRSRVITYIF